MVSVDEAMGIVLENLYVPGTDNVPLAEAAGRVLGEPVYADRDFPPFDRVMMDGIAVLYQRLQQGQREFRVEDVQPAGAPGKVLKDPGCCMEVMTGAVLPGGTDTVIRYEDIDIKNGTATVLAGSFEPLQNVHSRARDVKGESELLTPGILLSPAEVALLAAVGKAEVVVRQFPRVAIISTGDELVDVADTPAPHQIRRSNGYALYAALRQMGLRPAMHHLADEERTLEVGLQNILEQSDALILSGGVSRGKFDYVPAVLEKLHVEKLFHRVNQRPGKPFWFGRQAGNKVVFALPGNPVSTYMCFYKYIRPWLLRSLGAVPPALTAVLAQDFVFQPDLTCFLQVRTALTEGRLMAFPAAGKGSGDFANLGAVDGFLELPPGRAEFKAGEVFACIPFRLLG